MTASMSSISSARLRAAQACQRCSQRKIKCDGSTFGLPCSRCRSDGISDCKFNDSQRGRYQRKGRRRPPQNHQPAEQQRQQGTRLTAIEPRLGASNDTHSGDDDEVVLPDHTSPEFNERPEKNTSDMFITVEDPNSTITARSDSMRSNSGSGPYNAITGTRFDQQPQATNIPPPERNTTATSLAGRFEEFLRRRGSSMEGSSGRHDFVLLSESSPLSFALAEIENGRSSCLHDGELSAAGQANIEEEFFNQQRNTHPSHMSPQDISYLQSKGGFDLPEANTLNNLVEAFRTRFYPLYSIVNLDDFDALYGKNKLPWILLNAVCFIGATFCDQSTIHRSAFKRRSQARQVFYDRAKILFDLGYETNKIILLQSVLMLTFWGPQTQSYWNPSSWVGFATTIAASLGIHRNANLTRIKKKDRSLLRRLWWTVVTRDASSATLLGRPFRIRMSQCDSDMLAEEDFSDEISLTDSSTVESGPSEQTLYQIHMSKLSLILRQIVRFQSSGRSDPNKRTELHSLLKRWHSNLPASFDWSTQHTSTSIFATSLKIIFHHHLLLIYLGDRDHGISDIDRFGSPISSSCQIAASAAHIISSSALRLMKNSAVSLMPHEVFSSFFIAGIVFYRQIQHRSSFSHFQRSALDNCQMVLNDARECSDAANWMMCIFEFLLSGTPEPDAPESYAANSSRSVGVSFAHHSALVEFSENQPSIPDQGIDSLDWDMTLQSDPAGLGDDYFSIPNLYVPMGDTPFDLRF